LENRFVAVFDRKNEDCDGCAACFLRCKIGTIEWQEMRPVIDQKKCIGCGECIKICGAHAISLKLKGVIVAKILMRYQRKKMVNKQRRTK